VLLKKTISPIFLSFILLLGISCNNTDNSEQSGNKLLDTVPDSTSYEIIEKTIEKEKRAEFYIIENKAVVFFMLNKKEFKDLLTEMGESYRWDAEALFNNFSKQTTTFQSLLKKHNIECIISTSEKFEIKLKNGKVHNFDRIEKDQILGTILTDGIQEPRIEFGLYPNKELAAIIENFFDLKSIGNIPGDTLNSPKEENNFEENESNL